MGETDAFVTWYDIYRRSGERIEKKPNEALFPGDSFYEGRLDTILEIINAESEEEINRILYDSNDTRLLKTFSYLRGNLFSWADIGSNDEVLVIGEDIYWCAGFLSERPGGRTTFVSYNLYHLLMIAEKYPDSDLRLVYCRDTDISDFLSGFQYDSIFLSDTIKLRKNSNEMFLNTINGAGRYLSGNGRLFFAAENPFGLKFWSGCMDSMTGSFWSGIEGYPHENEEYLTGKHLRELVEKTSFTEKKILYPYPDCTFPSSIYSDEHLPKKGELTKNAFNWEKRINLFNEMHVWNNIIENDAFKFFSNGYLVVLSNASSTAKKRIYTKFSNDRRETLSIRTDLISDETGSLSVEKTAISKDGYDHTRSLPVIEMALKAVYSDTDIEIQRSEYCGDGVARLEYIEGDTIAEALGDCLDRGLVEDFVRIFSDFADILVSKADIYFSPSEEFSIVFGDVQVPAGLKCCMVTDIDLIVPNVILRDGKYGIIDYEWTFGFPIPVKFVIYRSIAYLFKGPRGRTMFDPYYRTLLFERYGIGQELCELFSEMENNFYDFTLQGHVSLNKIRNSETIKKPLTEPLIYVNFGGGFSEKIKYSPVLQQSGENSFKFETVVLPGTRAIRFDPAEHHCLIRILKINCEGSESYAPEYRTNGSLIGSDLILFNTSDPQILITDLRRGIERIEFEIEMVEISKEMGKALEEV